MQLGKMRYIENESGLEAGYEDYDIDGEGTDYEVMIWIGKDGKEKIKTFLTKKYGEGKTLKEMLIAECGVQGDTKFENLCKTLCVQFNRNIWIH